MFTTDAVEKNSGIFYLVYYKQNRWVPSNLYINIFADEKSGSIDGIWYQC